MSSSFFSMFGYMSEFLLCLSFFFHTCMFCFFFNLVMLLLPLPFKKHENENENENENASEGWIRRQFFSFSFLAFFCNQRKSFFPMLVVCWFYELCWWTVRASTSSSLCLSSLEQQDQIHIWFICLFVEHIAWLSEGCFLKLSKSVPTFNINILQSTIVSSFRWRMVTI